jgi:hypothetical protein
MRQASLYTTYKKANLKNWINTHKKQKDAHNESLQNQKNKP